ncbi:hypothetical protein L484_003341 [Morus notabilis]|uniref:Uncharacterized protein n=1 Tax=Morus notabilis TaxID=981085 RepID=W9RN35_9ROSA|nr:hypothetical protein L484_003341 [Morus notabilis]
MALTRLLFPLALLSLLIVIVSAEYVPYTQNSDHVDIHQQQLINHGHDDRVDNDLSSSTLPLDVDNLLGNLLDDKQDHNEQHKQQLGEQNFVPNDQNYEKTKPYQGQGNIVPIKQYYGKEQKTTYDQAHGGIYSHNNLVVIQGFVLCESEANKYYPLQGAEVEIICPSSYESTGYDKAPYNTILHPKTDEKGCFLETLPANDKYINLKECKAYPKYSPSEKCNVPAYTASNGVRLSLLRNEEDKAYYTAGNLIYTPNTHYSTANSYPDSNDHSVQNAHKEIAIPAKPISYKKSKPEGQEYTILKKPTNYEKPKSGEQEYSVPTKQISYKKQEPQGQNYTAPPPGRY